MTRYAICMKMQMTDYISIPSPIVSHPHDHQLQIYWKELPETTRFFYKKRQISAVLVETELDATLQSSCRLVDNVLEAIHPRQASKRKTQIKS